jgi:DtxR family Mn-dependent transcriptional regulator
LGSLVPAEERMTAPLPEAQQRIEEGLETLYLLRERGTSRVETFVLECSESEPESLLRDLTGMRLIETDEGDLHLTEEGLARAERVIRRHRLAEVLFHTVLLVEEVEMEATACVFEHILSTAAADRVCAFLGHPSHCPHGRAIPPGDCCRLGAEDSGHVQPLSEMQIGDLCEVVHIRPRDHKRLDRLGAYGLLPRSVILLHQKRPSFVVQIDETDLALDLDIARDIYVRKRTAAYTE